MVRVSALILPVLLLTTALPAYAQSSVTLRTGSHGDYMRAVFDWPKAVPYKVEQPAPDQLLLSFDVPASLSFGATEHGPSAPIKDVTQLSAAGENLKVQFKVAAGGHYRDFLVGSRVVVDVFAGPAEPGPQASAPPPEEKKAEVAKPAPVPEKIMPEKVAEAKPEPAPVTIRKNEGPSVPAVKAAAVQAEPLQAKAAAPLEPHVITVTATEAVGMAAFRRNGWLWLVMDRSSVNVPPQVAGEQAALFGQFQRMELKGGVAFRVKLPPGHENMYLYGEGGGLVWRIILTPNRRETRPVEPRRMFEENQMVRGAKLSWPFMQTTSVIDVPDPSIGDILKAVTMTQAGQFSGRTYDFADFTVLESSIGMALQPKVDDLTVTLFGSGVDVTRPGGLAVSRVKDINRRLMRQEVQEASVIEQPPVEGQEIRRIFDFDRWMMGGLQALEENQRILLAGMAVKDKNGRVQDLLTLAKMNVSNDRGQEAIGFLTYAASELPDISDSPEFRALHGAAAALSGKFEMAFNDLFHPLLTPYTELDYWRAYTLAGLEDWQQAVEMMPQDFTVLIGYPLPLLEKIGVRLAEVALRAGRVDTAESILAVLNKNHDMLKPWTLAAMEYLKGEAHRQSNENESATARWEPLISGKDDLYRAKAGLALTMLELQTGTKSKEEVIDRLEGLRYTWRGDELEAKINFLLGKLYIEQNRYLKGFTILRDSTTMSVDSDISREITAYMQQAFKDLLLTDNDLTPLEAVEVYEEFHDLTPEGDDGNKLVQKLAERLVEADLLGRAADILEDQVDHRLQGEEKARVAVRLGAITLLDKNARKAMKYLATGRDLYAGILTGDEKTKKLKEIDLLRARGLSQLNRTEEAIELLNGYPPDPVVNRLRADIAWQAGLWEDAAEALQDLVLDEALDLNRPLTEDQADLILNRAVALNLAGNRVALGNMRTRYEDAMKKTPRARLFDIVTRPRNTAILADKETIEQIVKEVDLFEDFLKTYRQDETEPSN